MIFPHHHCHYRRRRQPWILGTLLVLGLAGLLWSHPWIPAGVVLAVSVALTARYIRSRP